MILQMENALSIKIFISVLYYLKADNLKEAKREIVKYFIAL